jgi:DNA-binding helix-hairpin-helix protein with protein kinase domain
VKYVTATGKIIDLATRNIGRGGEGQVWPVAGKPDLVAKIFHHPTAEHRAKIEFMVANPAPRANGHCWVTWPLDILFTAGSRPEFAGYIMSKLTHAQPLFTCYNPAIRRQKCTGFDYRHLVRSARNLAAAFSLAHAHRFVIGDSNESNVFVSNDARVTLIDADSWQIMDAARGRTYRSLVAKPDFLPPELQNRSLKRLDRKPWHDNFALTVLLFKLTGEGSHPFDAVYHGAGDVPTLEARIAAGAFPYRDRSGSWSPKGLALPFDSLHPRLQNLFVQAFVAGHTRPQARPDARAWQEAIAFAESELQGCQRNSHHWFWGNQCVWCQRKQLLGGQDPFPEGRPKATRRVAKAAHTAPPAVPFTRRMPKTQSAPTSSKKPASGTSEFDKIPNRVLAAMVIITLASLLLATVLTLVAQTLKR